MSKMQKKPKTNRLGTEVKKGRARGRIIQGFCQCGNLQRLVGYNTYGQKMYGPICNSCKLKGRRTKGPKCEVCGFIPQHKCQLDVDHKNGNPADNDPENLWTLCANCHRLKTYINGDWRLKIGKKVSKMQGN